MLFRSDGIFPLTLTSSNGSITYDVKVLPREITIWEGPIYITWGDGGRVVVMASEFEGLTAGTKMRFYFDQVENVWAQAQINNGSWGGLVFSEIGSNTLVPTDIFGWEFASRELDVTLTQDILDQIKQNKANDGDFAGAGIIIQGSDLIFKKITVIP